MQEVSLARLSHLEQHLEGARAAGWGCREVELPGSCRVGLSGPRGELRSYSKWSRDWLWTGPAEGMEARGRWLAVAKGRSWRELSCEAGSSGKGCLGHEGEHRGASAPAPQPIGTSAICIHCLGSVSSPCLESLLQIVEGSWWETPRGGVGPSTVAALQLGLGDACDSSPLPLLRVVHTPASLQSRWPIRWDDSEDPGPLTTPFFSGRERCPDHLLSKLGKGPLRDHVSRSPGGITTG